MSWWLRDKIAYLIELVIALGIGYCIALAVGAYSTRGISLSRFHQIGQFAKQHGFDTSMFVLVAIPGAILAGLIYGGLLLIILDTVFGIIYDRAGRFAFVGLAMAASFVGYLIYIAVNLIRESRQR